MALTKIKLNTMVTGNLPDANIPDNITITNAGTATALQNARTINGTSFDGSANITVTSAAGTLTGNTLASGVTASSLTSVGTLTSLVVGGGSAHASANDLIVGGTSSGNSHGITIASHNDDSGRLLFSDNSNLLEGQIIYDHSNNSMTLGTSATTALTINSSQNSTFAGTITSTLSGGEVSTDANGHITSFQKLDVATAGGRFIGKSNRGVLGQIMIEQTADSTDGGYIRFATSPSGSTSPSERMRIDSSGNVGIGAAPRQYYRLDLYKAGNACIFGMQSTTNACTMYTQTGSTITGQMEFSTSQGWITTRTASPLKLGINNAEKLTIGADGNTTFAGVGNFTRDASGFNTYIFNDNGAGEGLHIKVKGNDSGQTGRYLIKAEGYGSSGAFTNNFLVDTDGNTTIGGDVTISKSSPKMTIFSSNAGDQESLVFDRNTASNGDSQEIKWKLQGSNYPGGYIRHEYIEAANSLLEFGCRENNTVTKMMTIGSSGDIQANRHSFIQGVADGRRGFMFSGGGGSNFGYPNVQGSGYYGMVFGRESINESGGGHYIAKSHWGGISIIGFSGSGVQGIDIVAWGYGNGGATVLKSGNWVGSLYRSYSTVNYHLVVDVGTTVTMFSILIGI